MSFSFFRSPFLSLPFLPISFYLLQKIGNLFFGHIFVTLSWYDRRSFKMKTCSSRYWHQIFCLIFQCQRLISLSLFMQIQAIRRVYRHCLKGKTRLYLQQKWWLQIKLHVFSFQTIIGCRVILNVLYTHQHTFYSPRMMYCTVLYKSVLDQIIKKWHSRKCQSSLIKYSVHAV